MSVSRALDLEVRARDKWGSVAQSFMVCEEAGELATAMAQFHRGRITADDLLSEAADGIIVSCAAVVLAGKTHDDLRAAMAKKLDRLEFRLNGGEGHVTPKNKLGDSGGPDS